LLNFDDIDISVTSRLAASSAIVARKLDYLRLRLKMKVA